METVLASILGTLPDVHVKTKIFLYKIKVKIKDLDT